MTVSVAVAPYRGLAAFGESELDGLLFFGRERETEVTTANLLASRLTVLYGPSGVGKSSLLRAGVARRVRELGLRRALGRSPDLACVVFGSWADEPVSRLADAVGDAVRPLVSPTTLEPPPGARLADVAEHWSGALDGDLCLILDQLEEYFVYHEHERGEASLVEALPELVSRPGLRVNVLLSLRDDELARLGAFKERIPHVFANARRLDRLDLDGARAAILGPLQRHNELGRMLDPWDIEPELVDAVLAETAVRSQPGRIEAPYLQLVMQRVWDAEAGEGSRTLRAATLRALGGAEAIVRDHLDHALASLEPVEQDAAARMFEHLVTPSGTKVAHRESDLAAYAHVDEQVSRDVLQTLGRERILRPLDDEGGGRYEIFHDVLAAAVLEWGRGREVARERALARTRQRRLFALAAAALVAVLVMIGITAYAFSQRSDARSEARHADASALAAEALAALPADPERGLVLADRAARREPSAATEAVLRSALQASRGREVLRGNVHGVLAAAFGGNGVVTVDGSGTLHTYRPGRGGAPLSRPLGGKVRAAAFSSDGRVAVIALRHLVEVRRLDGRPGYAFRAPAPVRAIAVDRDGSRVAIGLIDGRLLVHDEHRIAFSVRAPFGIGAVALDATGGVVAASGGRASEAWRVGGGRVLARGVDALDVPGLALSPDGRLLATASADGAVRIRTLPGGELVNVLVTPESLQGVVFSPDGTAVVTRSRSGPARVFAVAGREIAVLAGHTDAVTTAAFSTGGVLLVTGSLDGTARIWDPGVAPDLRVVARPAGCCAALVTGRAGTLVVAGGRALLYRDARLVRAVGHRVTAAALAGDEIVTGDASGVVRRGDRLLGVVRGPVTAVAASPTTVVAAGAAGVRIFTADRSYGFVERATVDALAISPDGKLVATAGADGLARIRRLTTGNLLHELRGHRGPVTGVAFSPSGTTLATSSADHDVRLWRVSDGARIAVLRKHFAIVSGVAFSADGRFLVSAGPSTAGLFHLPDATPVGFLRGHAGRIVGAGFARDDRTIVTASVDGTVRSYDCLICGALPDLVRLADRRLAASG